MKLNQILEIEYNGKTYRCDFLEFNARKQMFDDLFHFGQTGKIITENGKLRYIPFLEANNMTFDDSCCKPEEKTIQSES